jgi:hypothetical protein
MDDTSQRVIHYISLGRMTTEQWPGAVSTKPGAVDFNAIQGMLDEYYVRSDDRSATRCIDGRHDANLDEHHLGAQMPGGAPGAALAYRLGVDDSDLTRATFFDDAESMIDTFIRLALAPGGHKDDQYHDGGVGCGALDSMAAIVANMTNPKLVEDHKRIVKTLLGDDYDRSSYLCVMGAALVLQSRSNEYFRDNEKVLDIIEDRAPGSVSTLEGKHEEAFVFVNFVENTTLSSNRFYKNYGVQAFGYDVWRSKQLAHQLLDLHADETFYRNFLHARVMITIATLITLTDGSQTLVARFSK